MESPSDRRIPLNAHDPRLSPHRRRNALTGEWVLVSPHRTQRPWNGETTPPSSAVRPTYDPGCYLCPGNKRANGDVNPQYEGTFVFTNDFSAILPEGGKGSFGRNELLQAESETGLCRVVNFSPRHDLTLAEMSQQEIERVIDVWCEEYRTLGAMPGIRHVQIFENKGAMMGNSNPHPHCQIWSQRSIPMEPQKEGKNFRSYLQKKKRGLLSDYVKTELKEQERLVFVNDAFVVLVPFWAVWPYETLIVPKKRRASLLELTPAERKSFAEAVRIITVKYDNLFLTSFPYSSGIHQAPTDGKKHDEWHMHMHFYPPLLRSASVKKHMVGYEMMAEPQRDITPEQSAATLRGLPAIHYSQR